MTAPFIRYLLAIVLGLIAATAPAHAQPKPIRVGLANSFVPDMSQVFIDIAVGEFKAVLKQSTGLNGELLTKYRPQEVAEKVNGRQLDFGILYAHEFARAKKKYPELRPLLIAANKKDDKRAHIIVHKNSPAKTFADLRGKTLNLPRGTKAYCLLYLDKLCRDKQTAGPASFFGSIEKARTQFDALDEVARKKADATVIDTPWLFFYKELKGPVFANNLRILQQSEIVPPAVIVYKAGALDKATIEKVRDGLAKAHTTTRGHALMYFWHIDSFQAVPKDYDERLDKVLKEYPALATP